MWSLTLNGRMYLSGEWGGYVPKNKLQKKTCVEKKLDYVLKSCQSSRCNIQHDWGTYMTIYQLIRPFHLLDNKYGNQTSSKNLEESGPMDTIAYR